MHRFDFRKPYRHLLIASACLLAACGSDESAQVGTLNRGLGPEPESLDVHLARSVQSGEVLRDLGEGLVTYSANGELIPGAAERWEISEDGLEYRFFLRPEAHWSNGAPVLAEHFEYAWRRLVNPETGASYAQYIGEVVNALDIVAGKAAPDTLGVEAVGDHEFVVTLRTPVPYFISLVTHPSTFPVYPPSVEEHGLDHSKAGLLVSNGAYKLDRWDIGSVVALSRNDHYWNNASTSIDRVNHFATPDEGAEVNRYLAGELDTTIQIPSSRFAELKKERPDEVRVAPYLNTYYYGFNLTKPPFKDNPKLRQALSMAIDRESIVENIVARGEPAAYSWVPPGIANYDPIRLSFADLSADERHAMARRLYREAGYSEDNPLEVEIRYNTAEAHQRVALAVQGMWREVLGFEATLINEEFQVLLANMKAREVTQVFRSSWSADYNDAYAYLYIFHSEDPINLVGYADSEYDAMLERASSQTDMQLRRYYLEEAERALLSNHAIMPIYFYVSKHLVSRRVEGWQDNALDYHYSQHLSLNTGNR